jgi:hypothetical protein
MTWLDLFQFLNERANDFQNLDKFNWQQEVSVFDFGQLDSYSVEIVQLPDNKFYFSIDSSPVEKS